MQGNSIKNNMAMDVFIGWNELENANRWGKNDSPWGPTAPTFAATGHFPTHTFFISILTNFLRKNFNKKKN